MRRWLRRSGLARGNSTLQFSGFFEHGLRFRESHSAEEEDFGAGEFAGGEDQYRPTYGPGQEREQLREALRQFSRYRHSIVGIC